MGYFGALRAIHSHPCASRSRDVWPVTRFIHLVSAEDQMIMKPGRAVSVDVRVTDLRGPTGSPGSPESSERRRRCPPGTEPAWIGTKARPIRRSASCAHPDVSAADVRSQLTSPAPGSGEQASDSLVLPWEGLWPRSRKPS